MLGGSILPPIMISSDLKAGLYQVELVYLPPHDLKYYKLLRKGPQILQIIAERTSNITNYCGKDLKCYELLRKGLQILQIIAEGPQILRIIAENSIFYPIIQSKNIITE